MQPGSVLVLWREGFHARGQGAEERPFACLSFSGSRCTVIATDLASIVRMLVLLVFLGKVNQLLHIMVRDPSRAFLLKIGRERAPGSLSGPSG